MIVNIGIVAEITFKLILETTIAVGFARLSLVNPPAGVHDREAQHLAEWLTMTFINSLTIIVKETPS